MTILRGRKWKAVAWLFAILVLCLIYWPSLRWMVSSWLSSDYYSHGFLVPVISGFFIWTRREQLGDREPSYSGYFVLIVALALYVLSLLWEIRVLGALSIVILIIGLMLAIWGTKAVIKLTFPLLFLLFMIPFGFIQDLASGLQYTSVQCSAWIVQMIGLPIITSGTEIHLGNVVFTVGIVCSGINTLVALMALSAVYTHILKGTFLKRLGLFILAFPLAIGANILRIASIIIVAYFFNVETATGWYHDISSPIFFFLAFMLLVLIGWLLKFRINYDVMGKASAKKPDSNSSQIQK